MNSKAIKKQLLAAVAMVLVAAVALGSSTYAWFVASGSVEAYGMKVTAQSEGGLAISYGGEAWGTSATAGMDEAQRLYPASTSNLSNWSHATAANAGNFAAETSTREDITASIEDSTGFKNKNGYVVMKEFLIRSTAKEDANLSKGLYVEAVNVTVNNAAATMTMSTALRVGVRYVDAQNSSNNHAYIYGPVTVASGNDDANNATDNYTVYTSATDSNGTKVKLSTVGEENSPILPETVIIPQDQSKAYKVQIYIWFEGEDHNLYSDNFNVEDLNVSVKFHSMGLKGSDT